MNSLENLSVYRGVKKFPAGAAGYIYLILIYIIGIGIFEALAITGVDDSVSPRKNTFSPRKDTFLYRFPPEKTLFGISITAFSLADF